MKATRRAVLVGAVLWLTGGALLPGMASAQSSGTDEPVVYDLGYDQDLSSLNPWRLCCGADYEYMELVYDVGIDLQP